MEVQLSYDSSFTIDSYQEGETISWEVCHGGFHDFWQKHAPENGHFLMHFLGGLVRFGARFFFFGRNLRQLNLVLDFEVPTFFIETAWHVFHSSGL